MPGYGQNFTTMGIVPSMQPGNSLWVGNNYSTGQPNSWRAPGNSSGMNNNQLQPVNNIMQVMGPESAISFQVGPNSHVILMDSNRPVFYMKHSDDSGFSETKAYAFHEIPLMDPVETSSPSKEETVEVSQIDDSNYVTKEDIDDLKKQLNRRDYVTKKDFEMLKKLVEELRDK